MIWTNQFSHLDLIQYKNDIKKKEAENNLQKAEFRTNGLVRKG